MPVDNHVKRMLEELKSALAQAIRSSSTVTETIRKIRDQGFDLHLVLSFDTGGSKTDGTKTDDPPADFQAIASGTPENRYDAAAGSSDSEDGWKRGHDIELTAREAPSWVPATRSKHTSSRNPSAAPHQATFRLSGYDVSLLKSLGIDPTRTGRQARRRRPPGSR